jgi:hypothetical protein
VAQVSSELFRLSSSTPRGALAHGEAFLYGGAQAGASLHRGIDLSAGVSFEGRVDGDAGGMVAATFTGRAKLSAGLALQAGIPIDLFDPAAQAGLVGCFRAQAEASASVAANLRLELEAFRGLMRDRFDGPLASLLEVFLQEAVFEAGVWGRVAVAAEVEGQLVVAGSLLPSATGGAGFTCAAQYGAGFGWGAGAEFVANIGFQDPVRLLDRLADTTAALLLDEADQFLRSLDAAQAAAAAPALAVARILAPLASRSLLRVGYELASHAGDARDAAARAVAESFVTQAQQFLLQALADLALTKLGTLLTDVGVATRLAGLMADERQQLALVLGALRDRTAALEAASPAHPQVWLASLLDCVAPLDAVTAVILPSETEQDFRHALAMLWAAGLLVHRVVTLASAPLPGDGPFGAVPAPVPAWGEVADHVAAAVGRPSGADLTLADLVAFLTGADPLAELRSALPEAAGVLDWVGTATGTDPAKLVETLLVALARPNDAAVGQLLANLGTSLAAVVRDQVLPNLITPIRERHPQDQALRLWLDQMVVPALVALPAVVLPNLANSATEEGRRRLCEALSAVLLQSVGQFVLAATDILLAHALDEAERVLRAAGQEVRRVGESSPVLALVAAVAAGAVLPVTPTPGDVEALLGLAADVVAILADERRNLLAAAADALALGLGAEASRAATLQALTGGDDPPRRADLESLLGRVEGGAWRVLGHVVPEAIRLLAMHFVNEVKLLAQAIEQGAKAIVEAAVAAVEALGATLAELAKQIAALAERAAKLLADVARWAQELGTHLKTLAGQAVEGARAYGRNLIEPLIHDFPGWAKTAIRDLYDAIFDAVKWLFQLPGQILEAVGGWVREVIEARLAAASYDEAAVHTEIGRRIRAAGIADVHFDLAIEVYGKKLFDLGRITIPAGAVSGAIADVVMADPTYTWTVRQSADAALGAQVAQTQRSTLQQRKDGLLSEQQAGAAAARLAPGTPLAVRFLSPAGDGVVAAPASVRLRIDGANETFVEPTLGVPRRVSVRVNGREYEFRPEQWTSAGGSALELAFTLRLGEAPTPAPTTAILDRVGIDQPTRVQAHVHGPRIVLTGAPGPATPGPPLPVAVPAGAPVLTVVDAPTAGPAPAGGEPPAVSVRAVGAAVTEAALSVSGGMLSAVPIAEPVVLPVPLDAQGHPEIPGQAGANVVGVAVSDGRGQQASASLLVVLEAPLVVQVEPATIQLETDVEVVVRVLELGTGAEVGTGTGRVLVDGVEVGRTGRPFHRTFHAHHQPGHPGGPLSPFGDDAERVVPPRGVVVLAGYPDAPVPFVFTPAPSRYGAEFVDEQVARQMRPGDQQPASVTMRNTGQLAWDPADRVGLVALAPADDGRWGLTWVELPRVVQPGEEVTFEFTVVAPPAGRHDFQWRMLQEAAGPFGEATPDVVVEVQAR